MSKIKNFIGIHPPPVLKFYSEYPVLTDEFPIYPAKEYKRKWVKNCAKSFAKYRDITDGRASTITAAKCPGIRNLMEAGYIMTTWTDFTIETRDNKEFEVFYPTGLDTFLDSIDFNQRVVTSFDTTKAPMKTPTGDHFSHIIKVFVPYSFHIPQGYELEIAPVYYDDKPLFTACPGVTEGFQVDFNVHLFWHERNGRVTIPAGTPLCQLILRRKHNMRIEKAEMNDIVVHETNKRRFKKYSKFTW